MTKRKRQQTKSEALGAALVKCHAALWTYYRRPEVYPSDIEKLLACIVLTAPGRGPVEPLQAAIKSRAGVA